LAFIPTNSNGWWLFNDKIIGLNEFRDKVAEDLQKFKSYNIEGLQAPDDQTLVIKLKEPYPQMLYALTMSFTSPMPIEAVEKYNNILNDHVIGTGPYKLDEWQRLSGIKISRNPEYRQDTYPTQGDRLANSTGLLQDAGKKIPSIEKVQFHIIKESQTRWLNFRSGKIDYLVIPKDNFSTAIDENGNLSEEFKKEKIRLQVAPTLTYWWLSFNMKDPLLGKNLKLRQAIAHSIDVDTYIKNFTNNIGQKANSIYPPGVPGYEPANKLPYGYNIEKAKQLLAEAGFPEGKGLPELTYDVRGTSVTNRQQAEYIKKELAQIGIKVKTVLNTFPAFLDKARRGKLQFWQDGWAMDYPDAENSLQLLYSKNHAPGPNATFYSSQGFDSLFNELKVLPDSTRKFELLKEMEATIHRDLPWIMQYYARNYVLIHNRLKNYRHSDLIYNNIKYLRLDNN
jgi:ABC-type transport system substrate-binding protein